MVVNGWLAHNDKGSSSRHFNLLDASLPIAQSSCPKDKLYYCPVPVGVVLAVLGSLTWCAWTISLRAWKKEVRAFETPCISIWLC